MAKSDYPAMALADRNATEVLAQVDPAYVADWVVCFHAQQAIEKALKGLIESKRISVNLITHSISDLFAILRSAGVHAPADLVKDALKVQVCAVTARYKPLRIRLPYDRSEYLQLVDDVFDWVSKS